MYVFLLLGDLFLTHFYNDSNAKYQTIEVKVNRWWDFSDVTLNQKKKIKLKVLDVWYKINIEKRIFSLFSFDKIPKFRFNGPWMLTNKTKIESTYRRNGSNRDKWKKNVQEFSFYRVEERERKNNQRAVKTFSMWHTLAFSWIRSSCYIFFPSLSETK